MRSLLVAIFSGYGTEEVLEDIEVLLEETLLKEEDLLLTLSKLLILSTSIIISGGKLAICTEENIKAEVRKYLLSRSLLGATI